MPSSRNAPSSEASVLRSRSGIPTPPRAAATTSEISARSNWGSHRHRRSTSVTDRQADTIFESLSLEGSERRADPARFRNVRGTKRPRGCPRSCRTAEVEARFEVVFAKSERRRAISELPSPARKKQVCTVSAGADPRRLFTKVQENTRPHARAPAAKPGISRSRGNTSIGALASLQQGLRWKPPRSRTSKAIHEGLCRSGFSAIVERETTARKKWWQRVSVRVAPSRIRPREAQLSRPRSGRTHREMRAIVTCASQVRGVTRLQSNTIREYEVVSHRNVLRLCFGRAFVGSPSVLPWLS